MKSSTKWFIGIASVIIFIGIGMSILFVAFISSIVGDDVEVVTEGGRGEKIAVVELTGPIVSSEEVVKQFKKYREDRSIKSILFRIDSPGGGVVASQEIYDEVRKTRDGGKPVVVSMGALAASGGYYVACGATMIVANPGTLTGSIGVISQFMSVDSLLHKIGVTPNTIKSGKLKDAGSPFRPMTPEDRLYFQKLMDDVHRQFMDVVADERGIDRDTLATFADGRVFTGEQALDIGLVDTLGTYEDAIGVAAHLSHIKGAPTLIKERKRRASLFERVFGETRIPDFLGLKDDLLNQPILQYRMTHGL